jgi:hypothetical protein
VAERSFSVNVSRQFGGTVISRDGGIECGPAPTATRCGPVDYPWDDQVVLVATPAPGNMLGTWAGDCSGRAKDVAGEYVCVLDTTRYGADKFVAAVFGEAGRVQHPNYSNFDEPVLHGREFLDWIAGKPDTFECTYCHGSAYNGVGIALSCNSCHAGEGFADWQTDCTFCHGAPPPPPLASYPDAVHPSVSTDITECAQCHPETVDATGAIVPGGLHMNGEINGGHRDGYSDPAVHGRDFFEFISGAGGSACTSCHADTYDRPIAGPLSDRSCDSCHAAQGWQTSGGAPNWETNCSFCHGVKDATTQAGYVLAGHPTWATPPDTIVQRLTGTPDPAFDPVGAHTIHLTGSEFAHAFECGVCHEVPTSLAHISGREVRAAIVLTAPGQAAPDHGGYDTGNQTCATSCHGSGGSPAWPVKGLQCGGCHAVPPSTPVHSPVPPGDRAECSGCHPDTIAADGTLILDAHVNGTVERVEGHDPVGLEPFAVASVHGPQFLNAVATAVVPGTWSCQTCHRDTLGYCSSCHSRPASGGWVDWQTNCTFCHGQKTPDYTPADLVDAAPPDAIFERLTGVPAPAKSGQHAIHVHASGFIPSPGFDCASCHPKPASLDHISVDPEATVTFSAAGAFPTLTQDERDALPSPLGVYERATGTCTSYCHGSSMVGGVNTEMIWIPGVSWLEDCIDCHGNPPATGRTITLAPDCPSGCDAHRFHRRALPRLGYDTCDNCHHGSAPTDPDHLHVSGKPEIVFTPVEGAAKPYTGTWNPDDNTCAMSCHSTPAPRGWYPPPP